MLIAFESYIIKMKFGQVLVNFMADISNMFLETENYFQALL